MQGISLTLTVPELAEAERRLAALHAGVVDKTPLMQRLAAYLESTTQERFDTGTAPDGQRWTPSIRARLTGGTTLKDRGHLQNSFVPDYGEDFAAVGSNDIRARLLHFGGTVTAKGKALAFELPGGLGKRFRKSVVIPARPIVGPSAEDAEEIPAIAAEYLEEVGA